MCRGLHVKYPLFLSDFNETWILRTNFRNIHISNFVKIHTVGADLFHAERRRERERQREKETWHSWQPLSAIWRTRLKMCRHKSVSSTAFILKRVKMNWLLWMGPKYTQLWIRKAPSGLFCLEKVRTLQCVRQVMKRILVLMCHPPPLSPHIQSAFSRPERPHSVCIVYADFLVSWRGRNMAINPTCLASTWHCASCELSNAHMP
jgi:hypothetical protein